HDHGEYHMSCFHRISPPRRVAKQRPRRGVGSHNTSVGSADDIAPLMGKSMAGVALARHTLSRTRGQHDLVEPPVRRDAVRGAHRVQSTTFLLTYERMRWISAAALLLAVSIGSTPAFAQGIPGTRAYAAGRAGWDAIREGHNQEAAEAFALAIDAEPRDPSLHMGAGLAAYLLGK